MEITTDFCHFSVGDKYDQMTTYMATDTSANISLRFPTEALFSCDMTIVAIGGGGSPTYYGGGGSGYIDTANIPSHYKYSPISDNLLVNVGGVTEESRVDTAAGETIVRAHPGKSGDSWYGGDGYSGGGAGSLHIADIGGNGGSNGGDGNDSSDGPGGKGSGLDISTIALEHFKLTPAAGGEACGISGGGGGGVLVDGQGPPGPHNECGSYGAGGGGCTYYEHQGIILIEIKKKQ